MGNAHGALGHCFLPSYADDSGQRRRRRRRFLSSSAVASVTVPDEGLGHSFCYVPPPPPVLSHAASANLTKVCHSDHETSTSFRTISGAAISANAMAPPSTDLLAAELLPRPPAASFESSPSFASVPLQRLARFSASSSSSSSGGGTFSASSFRGFMSAPLEKPTASILFSGPLEKPPPSAFSAQLSRSSSHGLPRPTRKSIAAAAFRSLAKAVSRTVSGDSESAEGLKDSNIDASGGGLQQPSSSSSNWLSSSSGGNNSSNLSYYGDAPESYVDGAHQWAQGKAGEDRVHVVVSEEHGWVFVGIYDGFNGPDATDFLQSKLYSAVHEELTGLLWEDKEGIAPATPSAYCNDSEDAPISTNSDVRKGCHSNGRNATLSKTWEENRRQCNPHWAKGGMERQRRVRDKLGRPNVDGAASHLQVLKALSRALRKTEETFFDIADKMASENPELALMGSCVLAMLMKGEDVYLMNVGDSRAVMAQQDPWSSTGKARHELRSIKEEYTTCVGVHGGCDMDGLKNLKAMQLTMDHNTSVEEEVRRIRKEHPCDASAIANGRVKGSLKVTRAFGAGYLKQPKWNDALLEMFRIDYVGTSPYITCDPFLYHQKLRPMDKFLILSSDGLYQYFTNEEVVAQVEMFVTATPDGDPAQHLVEEVLLRAAKRAGMDLQELLNVPHGERRQYHDDISIVVISLEGKIWRSCV